MAHVEYHIRHRKEAGDIRFNNSIAKLIYAHNISAIYWDFSPLRHDIDDILWACPQKWSEIMIPRNKYLNQLIKRMNNDKIKIVTGIRKCGKSVLLNKIFYEYLLSQGIADTHNHHLPHFFVFSASILWFLSTSALRMQESTDRLKQLIDKDWLLFKRIHPGSQCGNPVLLGHARSHSNNRKPGFFPDPEASGSSKWPEDRPCLASWHPSGSDCSILPRQPPPFPDRSVRPQPSYALYCTTISSIVSFPSVRMSLSNTAKITFKSASGCFSKKSVYVWIAFLHALSFRYPKMPAEISGKPIEW